MLFVWRSLHFGGNLLHLLLQFQLIGNLMHKVRFKTRTRRFRLHNVNDLVLDIIIQIQTGLELFGCCCCSIVSLLFQLAEFQLEGHQGSRQMEFGRRSAPIQYQSASVRMVNGKKDSKKGSKKKSNKSPKSDKSNKSEKNGKRRLRLAKPMEVWCWCSQQCCVGRFKLVRASQCLRRCGAQLLYFLRTENLIEFSYRSYPREYRIDSYKKFRV